MKATIIVIFLALAFISCNREAAFVPIEQRKGAGIYSYAETILVKNPPKDKAELKKAMLEYRDKYGVPYDSVMQHTNVDFYIMSFYKYNRHTSYFIKHKGSGEPFSKQSLGYNEMDYLGSVTCWPCENDRNKRLVTIDINIGGAEHYKETGHNTVTDTIKNDCKGLMKINSK